MKNNFGMEYAMQDSGSRVEFNKGAVRESDEGKPRFSLIPPGALKRVAMVFTKGAKKYAPHNWLGLPTSRSLDSAIRHIEQYRAGEKDEDHLAHAITNLMFIMHQEGSPQDDIFNWDGNENV